MPVKSIRGTNGSDERATGHPAVAGVVVGGG
jgi:hypothetical protein